MAWNPSQTVYENYRKEIEFKEFGIFLEISGGLWEKRIKISCFGVKNENIILKYLLSYTKE